MSRRDDARLSDIAEAIEAIKSHLTRGSLDDGLVHLAVGPVKVVLDDHDLPPLSTLSEELTEAHSYGRRSPSTA